MTALKDNKYWISFFAAISIAFFVLGFFGVEVYRQAPPIPELIRTDDGRIIASKDDILTGQESWQSTGGQQLGSIWGHGAYQAPDWTADWLHREAVALLDVWAQREHGSSFDALDAGAQGALKQRLVVEMRTNTWDPTTGAVTISADRALAIERTAAHYDALFGGAPELSELREAYAMKEVTVPDTARRAALTDFFLWTAWAATTQRPDAKVTYTNNWPHEPLVDNRPSGANVVWSLVSIFLLLAAIGGLIWYRSFRPEEERDPEPPARDPFGEVAPTPSMRAVAKYVGTVVLLLVVQVILGVITAHYTVEGQAFYGLPLGEWLPYSLTRTWHVQAGMFWIATAFLAAGLFVAPIVGGRGGGGAVRRSPRGTADGFTPAAEPELREPRFQRLGVNVLFGALLLVVGGSFVGQYLAIHQVLPLGLSFWLGHQGYEYVDLGRGWQVALFVGLLLWLTLMLRALWPALQRKDASRTLVLMFAGASTAIGLIYGAGFFFGARTHMSVMEYWRWWIVHLWVEGFFEVFATAAIALIFARLGLVEPRNAGRAVIASSGLYLFAGIPGTFHHLYWSGTPTAILAVGATFSALEVVPLVLIGWEAWRTSRLQHAVSWMDRYRWPVRFFVGVAFWNLVGAGLFGFLINPPIALYFMQGLNTTPVHAHAALFGVYGLLSLGLMLVVARRLSGFVAWRERYLAWGFWGMNVGLGLMITLSLLPIGLAQTWASVETGLWYARSADFLQLPVMEALRWLRVIGDTVFFAGVACFAYFMLGLWTGWSYEPASAPAPHGTAIPEPAA